MTTCRTCKHWRLSKYLIRHSLVSPDPPEALDDRAAWMRWISAPRDEQSTEDRWGHRVRQCVHPALLFYQRPDANGATVCDGSQFHAMLLTGAEFGCVNHEPGPDRYYREEDLPKGLGWPLKQDT